MQFTPHVFSAKDRPLGNRGAERGRNERATESAVPTRCCAWPSMASSTTLRHAWRQWAHHLLERGRRTALRPFARRSRRATYLAAPLAPVASSAPVRKALRRGDVAVAVVLRAWSATCVSDSCLVGGVGPVLGPQPACGPDCSARAAPPELNQGGHQTQCNVVGLAALLTARRVCAVRHGNSIRSMGSFLFRAFLSFVWNARTAAVSVYVASAGILWRL